MSRPVTPVMSTFVQPLASSAATRSMAWGIVITVLAACTGYGAFRLFKAAHGTIADHFLANVGWVTVACAAALLLVAALYFRAYARASRLAKRTYIDEVQFVMDTRRVGEAGPGGQLVASTAIAITAEQFSHLLATPRPPVTPGTFAGATEVPRAVIHKRD